MKSPLIPVDATTSLNRLQNQTREAAFPLRNMNSGPSADDRRRTNSRRAATGHREFPVFPTKTSVPCLKGSVFDDLIRRQADRRSAEKDKSDRARSKSGLNLPSTVNSESRINPKNPVHNIDQNSVSLYDDFTNILLMDSSISTVTGDL